MKVREILAIKGEHVHTIEPDRTILDAVVLLVEHGIGALLVRDAGGAVAGIISERDVLRVCREFGIRSKNPRAALALVGDISKAYIALALFAPGQPSNVQWMMGIAAVIGHCWNPFLGWNGGKGVATTSGMLLYLVHWQLMLTLILYPTLRIFGRRMGWKQEGAISSMTTMFVLSTLVLIFKGTESGLFAYATLLIVVVRHRSNIREILS